MDDSSSGDDFDDVRCALTPTCDMIAANTLPIISNKVREKEKAKEQEKEREKKEKQKEKEKEKVKEQAMGRSEPQPQGYVLVRVQSKPQQPVPGTLVLHQHSYN